MGSNNAEVGLDKEQVYSSCLHAPHLFSLAKTVDESNR